MSDTYPYYPYIAPENMLEPSQHVSIYIEHLLYFLRVKVEWFVEFEHESGESSGPFITKVI
jgi:hypothetical protein